MSEGGGEVKGVPTIKKTRLPDQNPDPIRKELGKNSLSDKLKARGSSRLNVYGQEVPGTRHTTSGGFRED